MQCTSDAEDLLLCSSSLKGLKSTAAVPGELGCKLVPLDSRGERYQKRLFTCEVIQSVCV